MIRLYDIVTVIKTGQHAHIVEIDDNGETRPPSYLVEVIDEEKPEGAVFEDVVFRCEYDEIKSENNC